MRKRAKSSLRAAVATLVAAMLMPVVAQAQAQAQPQAQIQEPIEPPGLNSAVGVFDVLIVRPLAFTALPIGVAFFVPAALLAAPGGMDSVRTALDLFVTDPARFVFTRPLGEF